MSDAILDALRASKVFDPALPQYRPIDNATWATWSHDERNGVLRVGVQAIRQVPEVRDIEELVHKLGQYEPAVPTLIQLWQTCAVTPVRCAAGRALRLIGTPAARSALLASLDDHDTVRRHLAVCPSSTPDQTRPSNSRGILGAP